MSSERLFTCPVRITKAVQDACKRFGFEDMTFFTAQPSYQVYIEKNTESGQAATKVLLYFSHLTHPVQEKVNGKVPVLTLLMEEYVMTAVHFMLKPGKVATETNWRKSAELSFIPDSHIKNPIPIPFRHWLDDLPFANEKSDYVKKRIAGWEGYLTIQEQQADIADIRFTFGDVGIQKNFRRITLYDVQIKPDDWKKVKDLDIKFPSLGRDVGKVSKANSRSQTIEIEVLSYMEEVIRKTPPEKFGKEAVLSNFASLSQIRRLRSGFHQLEKGEAENPILEQILFEEEPPVQPLKPIPKLNLHHPLNPYQRRAVEGAFAAEDVYVIQGPPGTGKTTVISEICLQNAKAGLRTLVASQSNLAVDNALSRLLANKDIRILRVGRTESIEEEGKRFIEENIGAYWRDVTLQTITQEVDVRAERMNQMVTDLEELRPAFQEAEHQVTFWQEKANRKKQAAEETAKLQKEIEEIEQQMEQADTHLISLQEAVQISKEQQDQLFEKKQAEEQTKIDFPVPQVLENELTEAREKLDRMHVIEQLHRIYIQRTEVEHQLEETTELIRTLDQQLESVRSNETALSTLSKLRDIQALIEQDPSYGTPHVLFKLKGIEGIRTLMKTYFPALNTMEQYDKALTYFIQQLGEKKRPIRRVAEPAYLKADLDKYLEQGRMWLKERRKLSVHEMAEYVQGLYARMRYLAEVIHHYEDLTSRGEQELHLLRTELLEIERTKHQQEIRAKEQAISRHEELEVRLAELQTEWVALQGDGFLDDVKAFDETARFTCERNIRELERVQVRMNEFDSIYAEICASYQEAVEQHTKAQQELASFVERSTTFEQELEEKKKLLEGLSPLIEDMPEIRLEEVQKEWLSLQFRLEALEKEQKDAPLKQKLQSQWQELLEGATAEDVDEIRKLNVKYANVIGTTCVASARKDFVENYPSFDVVIIDEVSKATPPELLLPMLKGKKVILVGDHHQLPPLLGDDTLEETLEQLVEKQKEFTGKQEIEKLLKESLFERLYKNLPSTHKTMLAIQYRMHEEIMSTIQPFYQFDEEELQCGLEDSDVMRAHGLSTSWLTPKHHLVWMNTPHHPDYFEQRVKDGKSLWNPAEVQIMKQALVDLNDAVKVAKEQGVLPQEYQKSVGVISFYGEQVKQLDRLIQQELRLPHITMRTGTVDRFQGMEMEVIILSMVRNHDEGRGDIGFANDYRRLNVALSRAKELLILVGSQEMFTQKVKRPATKDMYSHVWQQAEKLQGVRTPEEVLGYASLAR